ncbi:MAG: ribosome small subunit-dependent GTPase A [Clostridiaceae bacterium]|nr:ribosome small subunit-dependent GTPase A [Clostridiaceae bacterium]
MPRGLILKGVGGFYTVESSNGFYECKVRGIFRKKEITPLAGDFVNFTITDEDAKEGWIEEIETRRNFFIRPAVANVNQVAIVMTRVSPEPDFLLVDKLLIAAEQKNITPIIIINKMDLIDEKDISEVKSIYRNTGYQIIPMSKVGKRGYEELHEKLKGCRTVFAGQSGVGKSTILNNIIDSWVMETGAVSSKIQRGRHTTRHVQLLPLDNDGYVVDTPGFSTMALEDIEYDQLRFMYPEFQGLEGNCRFNGCSHLREPGCAVKDSLKSGGISSSRYEGYQILYEELKLQYDNRYK